MAATLGEAEDGLREKTEKGAQLMTDIPCSQTMESGIVAEIAGYVPAAAVVERGQYVAEAPPPQLGLPSAMRADLHAEPAKLSASNQRN